MEIAKSSSARPWCPLELINPQWATGFVATTAVDTREQAELIATIIAPRSWLQSAGSKTIPPLFAFLSSLVAPSKNSWKLAALSKWETAASSPLWLWLMTRNIPLEVFPCEYGYSLSLILRNIPIIYFYLSRERERESMLFIYLLLIKIQLCIIFTADKAKRWTSFEGVCYLHRDKASFIAIFVASTGFAFSRVII